jgi:hypothetical protein
MNNTKHSRPFPRITYPKENVRKQIPSVCWLLILAWEMSQILSETPSSYLVKHPEWMAACTKECDSLFGLSL